MGLIGIYISMGVLMLYAIVGLFIFIGFYIPVKNNLIKGHKKFISIIIPFRNEEKNIPPLIESFKKINYPIEFWEIIFINDYSTDKSCELIQNAAIKNGTLLHATKEGKKAAIATGIYYAAGQLIATTDADCILPSNWLIEMNNAGNNAMVLGPIQLQPVKKFIHFFQEIELAALQSITASTANFKIPLMCNGANLAYQKKEFKEAALKPEIASGDDVFLLQDFNTRKLPITFLWNIQSIVKTKPVDSLNELIQQKIRWASKSKHYKNYITTAFGVLMLAMNAMILLSIVGFFISPLLSHYSLMVYFTKVFIDIIIVLPYLILIKKPYLVLLLPAFVFLYPFYFIYIFICSIGGKFTWKERKYHA